MCSDVLVKELAASLGVQLIVESHPVAPRRDGHSLSNLEVWSERDVAWASLTLCELLGHGALPILSGWVDFFLTERQFAFCHLRSGRLQANLRLRLFTVAGRTAWTCSG